MHTHTHTHTHTIPNIPSHTPSTYNPRHHLYTPSQTPSHTSPLHTISTHHAISHHTAASCWLTALALGRINTRTELIVVQHVHVPLLGPTNDHVTTYCTVSLISPNTPPPPISPVGEKNGLHLKAPYLCNHERFLVLLLLFFKTRTYTYHFTF